MIQVFGIILIIGMGEMQTALGGVKGVNAANICLCALLLLGLVDYHTFKISITVVLFIVVLLKS